ncbi:MAG: hypothetical protein VX834_01110 [Myxococcota bacterium]|nr:hypothetical protein [Myxococcota bacterium]
MNHAGKTVNAGLVAISLAITTVACGIESVTDDAVQGQDAEA